MLALSPLVLTPLAHAGNGREPDATSAHPPTGLGRTTTGAVPSRAGTAPALPWAAQWAPACVAAINSDKRLRSAIANEDDTSVALAEVRYAAELRTEHISAPRDTKPRSPPVHGLASVPDHAAGVFIADHFQEAAVDLVAFVVTNDDAIATYSDRSWAQPHQWICKKRWGNGDRLRWRSYVKETCQYKDSHRLAVVHWLYLPRMEKRIPKAEVQVARQRCMEEPPAP